MELHPQILKCWDWQQEACDRNGESGGSRNHMDQLCLQLCSQPEHPLKCAWAGPQVKQQKCLTPLPNSALV